MPRKNFATAGWTNAFQSSNVAVRMKLRLLLPLLALPVFATVSSAQTADPSPSQLRRDFITVQQQRDAMAAQVDQLKTERDALQAERDALKSDAEAAKSKVTAAETSAVEASEAVRAQKEAEMTVDMTVRAYALKEQEAIEANKLAAAAAEKLREAELARDAALAEAEQSRQNAAAEVARTTAERDAAKQSEAAAATAKAAMQNELYAAQIRIENLSRALAARSGVPFTPGASIAPTPVATEQPAPAIDAKTEAPKPEAATASQVRTHTVAEGESLSLISFKYYQSPNKWDKIVAANRTKLKNPDMLRPGMVLVIP